MTKALLALLVLVMVSVAAYGLNTYLGDGRQSDRLDRELTVVEKAVVKDAFREIPSVRSGPESLYAPWLRVVEIEVNKGFGECLEPFTARGTEIRSFAIRFQPYTLLGTPHSFYYVTICRGNEVFKGLAREDKRPLEEFVKNRFK